MKRRRRLQNAILAAFVGLSILFFVFEHERPRATPAPDSIPALYREYGVTDLPQKTGSPDIVLGEQPQFPVRWEPEFVRSRRANEPPHRGAIVVARTKDDDISWLRQFPEWSWVIYRTDGTDGAGPPPPASNGRTKHLAYLSYIVDNHLSLDRPSIVLFLDANQGADSALNISLIKHIRDDTIRNAGYVNLRCVPDCADVRPSMTGDGRERAYAQAWNEIFGSRERPPLPLPPRVAVPGAQFAVYINRLRRQKKEQYEIAMTWLYYATLQDRETSAWIFENLWHVLLREDAVHCPEERVCRCEVYGLCE